MTPATIAWPGGEHPFALPIGQLRAMQATLNSGPEEVFNRLRLGTWRPDDVIEVLRLGLIGGGGVPESDCGPLVHRLVAQGTPWAAMKIAAGKVLAHALFGPEDDQVGKPEGVETPPESGSSPASTETRRSSGSRRKKSTK